jgi:penicillin-binding protein 1C
MNWLHRDQTSSAPRVPAGVTNQIVTLADFGTTRREWFIRGTETPTIQRATAASTFRIAYPTAGSIIALDPDIPWDQQKVFFESQPQSDSCAWILDGSNLGFAGSVLMWTPERGKHTLALVDRSSRILDTVFFEVRGNLATRRPGSN